MIIYLLRRLSPNILYVQAHVWKVSNLYISFTGRLKLFHVSKNKIHLRQEIIIDDDKSFVTLTHHIIKRSGPQNIQMR
jgi:hypothetical protein